jgi:hypothetical protein
MRHTVGPGWLAAVGLACAGAPGPGRPPGPGDTGSAPGDTGCAAAGPSLDVGGGALAFEPVDELSDAVMVHGPQGGWHVLGSARVWNTTPIVRLNYTITVERTGARVSNNDLYVQLVPEPPCAGVYPGMFGYLDVSALADGDRDTPPELLVGEVLILAMRAEDEAGVVVEGALRVVAAPDPIDTGAAAAP